MVQRLIMFMFVMLRGESYRLVGKLSMNDYLSLKRASWSYRNLSTVPLILDNQLQELDLSNNMIRTLKSINLQFLEKLDVSYNSLSLIHKGAFKNLVRLHQLNLAGNSLNNNIINNSQAVTDLHTLRGLDISENNLDEGAMVEFLSNASSLDLLTATGNAVSKLTAQSFANTKNLRVVNLENNLISNIEEGTFNPLKRLTKLSLARNNLAYICNFKLFQVTYLNLSRNSIEFFITQKSEEVYHLEVLDLSYNNLLYFPILPKHSLLKYLQLRNNRLGVIVNSISEAKHLYEDITGKKQSETDKEDCVYSYWKSAPIAHLDLSHNYFSSFPVKAVLNFKYLKTLNMSYNCLRNISSNAFGNGSHQNYSLPSLRHINLKNNNLQYLSPALPLTLPNIETMILQSNSLRPCHGADMRISDPTVDVRCASFRNITTLKHLDLQENGIQTLLPGAFANSPLASLNLAGNKYLTFAKDALVDLENTLQTLSVGQNKMTDSQFALECMRKLRILNVSDNNLRNLPRTVACSPLVDLDLRNNSLASLENMGLSHLSTLHISGNAFNCCQATWLEKLHSAKVSIADIGNTLCFQHTGRNITYYTLEDYPHVCIEKIMKDYVSYQVIILLCSFCVAVVFIVIFVSLVKMRSRRFMARYSIFGTSSISLNNLVTD